MTTILRLIWHGLLALAALAIVADKALITWGVIKFNPGIEGWVLLFAGIVVFVESIVSIFGLVSSNAQMVRIRNIEKTVLASLKAISVETGVDVWYLGGSVFLAKKRGLRRESYLHRVVRYRLSDSPQPSSVNWTDKKGTIGEAWHHKNEVHNNWTKIAERHGGTDLSQVAFDKLPERTRSGFSVDEFRGISSKYAEILAVPIWNAEKTRCVGILSIDIPMTVEHSKLGTCLASKGSKEIVATCAAVLSELLDRN